ncbi:hypothetical protein RIF29_07517 [Crotalaria pallida]|uniref:C2H2-type domain-containing protein n=1 Tax=Crotalaria pallida TaxID=3830 RepID=A0AAN9J5D4_CROPI
MPMNNASETLWQRELEKEQIRREIIASEIERRRELEEEVRRELAMERGWGMTMAAAAHGFSYEERVSTMRLNPSTNLYDNNARLHPLVQQLPQLMHPAEVRPSLETNHDKVIKLGSAKFPSPSQYRFGANAWPQPQVAQLVTPPQPQVAQLVAPAEDVQPSPDTNVDKVIKLGPFKFLPPGPHVLDTNAWPQPQLLQGVAPTEEFKPSPVINNDKVVKLCSVSRFPFQYQFDNNAWPQPQLPELMAPAMAPAEFKPSLETSKDKVIKLCFQLTHSDDANSHKCEAKPDGKRYDAKRKALSAPDVDGSNHLPSGLRKKPKEEWSCAVCHVSATSEKGLKEHLQGKKHTAKEKRLRRRKLAKSTSTSLSSSLKKSEKSDEPMDTAASGLDAKADRPPLQLSILTLGDINQKMADKGEVKSKNEEQLAQKNVKSDEPMDTAASGLDAKADRPPLQPSIITLGDINQKMADKGAVNSENEGQSAQKNVKSDEPMDTATSGLEAKADRLPIQSFIALGDIKQTLADRAAVESKNEEQLLQKNVKSNGINNATLGLSAKADSPSLQSGLAWGDINQPMTDKVAVKSKNEEPLVQKIMKSNEPMDITTYAKADKLSFQSGITLGDLTQTLANKCEMESKNEEQRMQKIVKLNESMDIATGAKADKLTLRPGIMWGDITKTKAYKGVVDSKNEEPVQRNQNIGSLKNENLTANGQEVSKQNASFKRKHMRFWCEMCQVGAVSRVVMESHKRGKKHLARAKNSRNNGSVPPTSSVPVEAPALIKDTGAVNEEAVTNMESSSHDSDV